MQFGFTYFVAFPWRNAPQIIWKLLFYGIKYIIVWYKLLFKCINYYFMMILYDDIIILWWYYFMILLFYDDIIWWYI